MERPTSGQIAAFRLRSHHLTDPLPPERLVEVVRDSGGIQAQVMNAARLSIRVRTQGLRPQHVNDAMWKDHSLVRLWCMRQCVHLLPTSDLPLYVAALGSSLNRINRGWLERNGMDKERTRVLLNVALEALEGGPLTREELGREVKGSVRPEEVKWVTSSWGGILTRGCYTGELIFGPMRGQNTTFIRRDQVLKDWDPPEEKEAKETLVRRYLHAYGPARVQDFVNWSATTVKEFKPVWEDLDDGVVELQKDGNRLLMLRDDYEIASSLEPEGPVVNLLGHFDTYLLGHKERTQVVEERNRKLVFRPAGWIYPVVLVNGMALGNWSADAKAKATTIDVEPFGRFPKGVRPAIRQEAKDLGRFWGTKVSVEYP